MTPEERFKAEMAYKQMRDHARSATDTNPIDPAPVWWSDVADLPDVVEAVYWLRECLDYIEKLTSTSNFDNKPL